MKRNAGKQDSESRDLPLDSAAAASKGVLAGASFCELQERMLQISQLATMGEMAAGLAHELNQPLTAIANYAQGCERLLARVEPEREALRGALREIAAQAVRAGDILHRVRGLTRSRTMRRESVDINATIRAIAELVLAEGHAHGARVRFELGADLPRVAADAAQVQHVVLNLVRNGVEAMSSEEPMRRELCVRTGIAEDGDVEIAVSDCGPGLAPQVLERMFDPFFSTKPEGTGLGLPISNTVVRAHGGTLRYRANVPSGACFYIRLPDEEESKEES